MAARQQQRQPLALPGSCKLGGSEAATEVSFQDKAAADWVIGPFPSHSTAPAACANRLTAVGCQEVIALVRNGPQLQGKATRGPLAPIH